ncbi:hypothetical protein GBA65_00720 [Rubrobacter marinus]|uniref:Response regulatory domain-containing protein n=1 Tax=Rubrobacter marinus TaxID=2653852 RepID=A0A6G8PSV2_9ACTN|nr:hypothetical protein [Rubrobacter marinus]QIN77277.1 hypothetical protein GBA65_00720 [Rubrobacter marinus]
MQVLVVFDDDYRSYREAIAVAIQALRPEARVTVAEPSRFEKEAVLMAPDLVICDGLDAGDLASTAAWIQLSNDSERPARLFLDGRLTETSNPTIEDLLSLFDTVERLNRSRTARG